MLLAGAAAARAEEADAFKFFAEEAPVTTAARRPQAPREAPLSVEVITAEDIRNSGAIHLWDLFRFRAGITVLENQEPKVGNRAIVSIRDFPANFVDDLQVLIDGRSVYNIDNGGVLWEQLPVQMQDIERIEIVRGPSSAIYGSNAGAGVINIITKKPGDRPAGSASFLAGSEGGDRKLSRTEGAVEAKTGAFRYRVSGTHQTEDGYPTAAGGAGNDYLLSNKGSFRGVWDASPQSSLELFSGGSWDTAGIPDTSLPNDAESRIRSHFEMAKWNQTMPGGSNAGVFVSRSEEWRTVDPDFGGVNNPSPFGTVNAREVQYDVEAQHAFDLLDGRLRSVYGGNWRLALAYSDQRYAGAPRQEDRTARGFASTTFQATDSLTAFGAVSVEDSDYGGVQPSYQVSLSQRVAGEQSLRLSSAYSTAQPSAFKLHANNQTSATMLVVGNPDTPSEKLTNVEAGYIGEFLEKRLKAEANLFYQHDRDVSTLIQTGTSGPVTIKSYVNDDEVIERGVESKLTYRWTREDSVYANYSFENITNRTGSPAIQQSNPAHTFNFGGAVGLGRGFSASANAGWNDRYMGGDVIAPIAAYWRLDARLAWACKSFEVFAAGQNLARPTHQPEFNGLPVPRTVYGGVSAKF
ncbi:MAG TPA: TonB-dependent receptor [Elusimicrobiota bacterium]|nr:TonB-dependent receptor [Elusimicrobiota bacterium]